jgi:hypothetical protein
MKLLTGFAFVVTMLQAEVAANSLSSKTTLMDMTRAEKIYFTIDAKHWQVRE